MDIDTQQTIGGESSSNTNEQRNDAQQMQAMDSSALVTHSAAARSNSPPGLLLSGHEQSAPALFSPVLSPVAVVPVMVIHEDETWMPGRSSLQTQSQSPPLYSAPPAASPPLPSSNPPFIGQHHPMQLSSSTSPSLFDVGAAAAASASSSQLPTETAIVHSFLAFSPSPPTTASQSGAASQADENMGPQQTATLQQSQAHQQQPQTQPLHARQQPTAVVHPPPQAQHAIAPSAPAPFLIPLFSPSPTLDGHALPLHAPSGFFDLHADLFSPQPPALQHAHHQQLPTHSVRALTLLDVSTPPPMPLVPRNSPRLVAAPFVAASPASASLTSGSPSPRLHHPRPQQHSPLQRYATELEVAEFFHSQNQLSERLASEIEAIQRRRQLRESVPHMELAPTAAAASSPHHPRTAHIAAHYPSAAVVTQHPPHQPFSHQRPMAALAPSVERAVRVDAQHHSPLSRTSTSLPRNRRIMAPVIHVPQHHTVVVQEMLSPPSIPPFRLSTSSAAGSAKPHAPTLPAQPHVPLATRAAPMSRVPHRAIVSPQRSPAPSMHCTRAAAAAAGSCSHASPAASIVGQGTVMMEDIDGPRRYHRPPDSGGSNSVASLGSAAAAGSGGRRSMSRALSPLTRGFLSPPPLPGVAASSAASAASDARCESPDLLITRKPRAAPTSKRKHCDWPGCSSHFAKLSALIRHRRVHTKEKPFVCESDGCTAAFSEKGNLVRHEEEMHADHRKFACPFSNYCAQRFRRAAHLEQHLTSRHAALGEDITKPWLFHAPPDEPAQAPIKRKWRAAAAAAAETKKEASTGTASSATQTAVSPPSEPLTETPNAAASMRPFSFASSSLPPSWPPASSAAASFVARSDMFLPPSSALHGVPSSSDRRFVINTAAVEAAAAVAAAGSTTTAATMPLQRVRVPPLAAAASITPAASLRAGSKRRLAALSPPQPLLSDSSSSSDASLPLLVAMDALHLPSAHDTPVDDNAAAQPRSPRPKRSRRAAASTKPAPPLAQMDRKSNGKSS